MVLTTKHGRLSLVLIYHYFKETCSFNLHSSAMKLEATASSKMLENFCLAMLHYILYIGISLVTTL